MNRRKNLKGFTLIELIVVMAVFGLLMTAVMAVITPLNKLSKRASIQEANSAAVDNIKTYFEGTLRYSDCIEVCVGGLTNNDGIPFSSMTAQVRSANFGTYDYTKSPRNVNNLEAAVINFIDNHYTNRTNPGTDEPLTGKVRVLKLDNTLVTRVVDGETIVSGGEVTEYEYDFKAGYTYKNFKQDKDGNTIYTTERVNANLSATPRVVNSVINPEYYNEYSFYFAPGYREMVTQDASNVKYFDLSDDKYEDYYASLERITNKAGSTYSDFSEDMFSISVVAYKNDRPDDTNATSLYRGKRVDDPATAEDESLIEVFQSPFALSNINMSLVNIKSEFSQGRDSEKYGPVRYLGTPEGETDIYFPDTLVKGVNDNWKYEAISGDDAPKIAYKLFAHPEYTPKSDTDTNYEDAIYFIYTLPEYR